MMAALLMGALNATAKDYHYTTVPGDAMKTRIYTLDNGLKVYMSVNKEKPRLQANIAVKTGSRNDPAETTGLAHYLEHLMFKGTTHFGTTDVEKEKPYQAPACRIPRQTAPRARMSTTARSSWICSLN